MSTSLSPTPAVPRVTSLSCPSCGAGIELHAQGWAVTVICASCRATLDATDPNLRVLQQAALALKVTPSIPLGTRGTWKGVAWEVIGFQLVTITVEGVDYSWTEYVCFNPYHGFFYLSEYEGHWNVIQKLRVRPVYGDEGGRPVVRLPDGQTFKHFQTADARTAQALGEFPWELRVGDTVRSRDFIAPPYLVSAEATAGEVTWSLGTYTPSEVIEKAFSLKSSLRRPSGAFANQPNPHKGLASAMFSRFGVFAVLLVVMLTGNALFASDKKVFEQSYEFVRGTEDSAAFVTPGFSVEGRTSNVAIDVSANVDNNWMYLDLSLINEATGDVRNVSRQVSYYSGSDSDGRWSEGSKRETVRIASVPAGRYFLRVQPEGGEPTARSIAYSVMVRRDVPHYGFYALALGLLLLPPLLATLPAASFEGRRWAESDYGSATGVSGGDDDE